MFSGLTIGKIYPLYLDKVQKKGRTESELIEVISWLTGFSETDLRLLIEEQVSFKEFFERASLNENAGLITGVICGYRVEELKNPLTKKARYLDKLVDELAKGKTMAKILRSA